MSANHLRLTVARWHRARHNFFAKAETGAIWPDTKAELEELANAEGQLDLAAGIVADELVFRGE